jgi:polyisoprenoid-binding protein YceI
MPRYERIAAHLGHLAIYLTLFLQTLSGWAMISTSDRPSVLYQYTAFPLLPWLSDLPVENKKAWEKTFEGAHEFLGNVLLVLLAIHIAAALRHAILLRDGILTRMLPRFGRSTRSSALVILLLASASGVFWSNEARALEWSVNPQKSQIGFEATGGGYTTKGTFSQYRTEIEFDPDLPEETAVRVSLDMASAATGSADVDSTLSSPDYFNPSQFPTADFTARGAQSDGNGGYVLKGRLTLKGVTKPISLPFTIDIKDGTAIVRGETKINRLDFGIGPETVAGLAIDKEVKLTINLTAVKLTD